MSRRRFLQRALGAILVCLLVATMAGSFPHSVGAAPPAPMAMSPGSSSAPGTTISTLTPTLQWTPSSGAEYYALAISRYPYGSGNIIYNPQELYGSYHAVPAGYLAPGEKYRWNMQAHDSSGWSTISNTLYFQTRTNESPTCSVTASPRNGLPPLSVTFSMSASDPNGPIASWRLDVDGDGSPEYSGTGAPPSTRPHTYSAAGPTSGYSVVLMVTDSDGATGFDTETVLVGTNQPPLCSLDATPTSGPAPLTVTFAVAASDPDGSVVMWAFDADGDGDTDSSGEGIPPSTITHTYTAASTYTAVIMVSDDKDAFTPGTEVITVSQSATEPIVFTEEPSSVTSYAAVLNGTLASLGTQPCVYVSFEWGTTPGAYSHETPTVLGMTAVGSFRFSLDGLSPGNVYYFRAKGSSEAGSTYGTEKQFYTPEVADDKPPVVQITNAPSATVNAAEFCPYFAWTGRDDTTPTDELRYSYRLDPDGEWSAWTTETDRAFPALLPGTYSFSIRAKDAAENVDTSLSTASFVVQSADWESLAWAMDYMKAHFGGFDSSTNPIWTFDDPSDTAKANAIVSGIVEVEKIRDQYADATVVDLLAYLTNTQGTLNAKDGTAVRVHDKAGMAKFALEWFFSDQEYMRECFVGILGQWAEAGQIAPEAVSELASQLSAYLKEASDGWVGQLVPGFDYRNMTLNSATADASRYPLLVNKIGGVQVVFKLVDLVDTFAKHMLIMYDISRADIKVIPDCVKLTEIGNQTFQAAGDFVGSIVGGALADHGAALVGAFLFSNPATAVVALPGSLAAHYIISKTADQVADAIIESVENRVTFVKPCWKRLRDLGIDMSRLIYRVEIVQILDEGNDGFIPWEPARHGEDVVFHVKNAGARTLNLRIAPSTLPSGWRVSDKGFDLNNYSELTGLGRGQEYSGDVLSFRVDPGDVSMPLTLLELLYVPGENPGTITFTLEHDVRPDWWEVGDQSGTVYMGIKQVTFQTSTGGSGAIAISSGVGYVLASHSTLSVRDPLGRIAGYDPETGLPVNEIPGAVCSGPWSEPQYVLIEDPVPGEYSTVLYGTSEGEFTLTLMATGDSASQSFTDNAAQDRVYWSGSVVGVEQEVTIESVTPPMVAESFAGVTTASGSGEATFGSIWGVIGDVQAVAEGALPGMEKPPLVFPHGFFEFSMTGLSSGGTAMLTLTLPSAIPVGSQYWGYGRTTDNSTPHWYPLPIGDDDGDDVITVEFTDGGLGDDDLVANGQIAHQGGPGWPAPQVLSLAPGFGGEGQALDVAVIGASFTGATDVSFGAGITVNSVRVDSDHQITANIRIGAGSGPGARDVAVVTPAGAAELAGGFVVLEVNTISGTVYDMLGANVPDVTVFAFDAATSVLVGSDRTDSQGSYQLFLAAGTYNLVLSPQASTGFEESPVNGVAVSEDVVQNVVLVASGLRLSGVVRTSEGMAVPGAVLEVSSSQILTSTATDENGYYELALPAGTYTCRMDASASGDDLQFLPALVNFNYLFENWPITSDTQRDIVIDVVRLSGTVTNDSAAAVSGVSVSAYGGAEGCSSEGRAVSGEDGTYTMVLVRGIYSVAVDPAQETGLASTFMDLVDVSTDASLNVIVNQGLKLSGVVSTNEGSGIPGAVLCVQGPGLYQALNAATDENGYYELFLPAGTYTCSMEARASGGDLEYVPAYVSNYEVYRDWPITSDTERDIVIEVVRLSGAVTGPDAAVPGVSISAYGGGAGCWSEGHAVSAEDGTYSMVLTPGTYDVGITPPAGTGLASDAVCGFTISADAVLPLELDRGIKVSGVVQTNEGATIPGATIYIDGVVSAMAASDENGYYEVFLPAGTYTCFMEAWASGSDLEYVPACMSKYEVYRDWPIATDTVRDIVVEVVRLSGTVIDPSAAGVSGVSIYASGGGGGYGSEGHAVSGEDGTYSMVLTPGSYWVEINPPRGSGCPKAAILVEGPLSADTNLAVLLQLSPTVRPLVTTNDAGTISKDAATLNGILTDLGTATSVRIWFEWGTTAGGPYPSEGGGQWMNRTGAFYLDVGGLDPGTTYYFRVRAEGHGTRYGNEMNFTTVEGSPPLVPALVYPADGGLTANSTTWLDWSDVTDPSRVIYQLQVDDRADFSSPAASETSVASSEYTFTAGTLPDGTYYWRVRALDGVGNPTDWSTTWSFTVDTTSPPVPAMASPANAKLTTDNTPWLDWSEVSDPSGVVYQLQVEDNADFSSPVLSKSGLTSSSRTVSPALPDGVYYWRARAVDGAGNSSDWTSAWSFTVDATTPSVPVLLSQANGKITRDNTPWLDWSDVTDATGVTCQLQVDDNADFSSPVLCKRGMTSSSRTLSTLADGTYYWRVRVVDGAGNASAWTAAWSLTVDTVTPLVPTLVYPADGRVTSDTTPWLDWSDVTDATGVKYQLQVDNNADYSSPVVNKSGLTASSRTLSILAAGTYYWRVRVVDGAGNASAWTAAWSFTVV